MGVIFIVGVVLVSRCQRDKREGGFTLAASADYELRHFDRIPRANYQPDFYGHAEDIDAARPGPSVDDEFETGIVPYGQGVGADSLARKGAGVVNGNAREDEFTMGTLPAWDLSKLAKSEVAVGDRQSTTESFKGSRENLLGDDRPPEKAQESFANLGITFKESTKGEEE